ncbi:MAG: hypothetical protein IKF14_09560 [Atopobiaceae bacterium]|nr:hypothetical protein [Atopobiaceae bacterium]
MSYDGFDANEMRCAVQQTNQSTGEMFADLYGERQMMVIGNGFDLACGLRSSYADFFGGRLQRADSVEDCDEEEWKKVVDENRLTVWDFILRLGIGGPEWCNLEKVIGDWVLPAPTVEEHDGGQDETSVVDQLLDILKLPVFHRNPPRIDEATDRVVHKLTTDFELRLRDVARCVWHRAGYEAGQGMDRSQLLDFLLVELHGVEEQFMGYLLGQGTNNGRYLNEAVSLLADMAWDGLTHDEEVEYDKEHTSVLSFNYTTPFIYSNRIVDEANVVNIHGRLGAEIIFGVDGKECMGDLDALPFTKTYRVASMGVKMGNPLYDTSAGGIGWPKTATIKFFGHSLGEADYSYFQSIFDGVNLYGGGTRLVFYYRPWPGKDEDELHAETVRAVTRLLTTYGGTLDNRDHGKNLMHKLLLEGRLEVKRLMKRAW